MLVLVAVVIVWCWHGRGSVVAGVDVGVGEYALIGTKAWPAEPRSTYLLVPGVAVFFCFFVLSRNDTRTVLGIEM